MANILLPFFAYIFSLEYPCIVVLIHQIEYYWYKAGYTKYFSHYWIHFFEMPCINICCHWSLKLCDINVRIIFCSLVLQIATLFILFIVGDIGFWYKLFAIKPRYPCALIFGPRTRQNSLNEIGYDRVVSCDIDFLDIECQMKSLFVRVQR